MSDGSPLRIGLAGCQAGLEALTLDETWAMLVEAERSGLDGVWVNEEHLGRRGPRRCWATLPFLSHVAGRVPRIRLGSAALLLPLHHPLRLAEEIGSLCCFAPGRVMLGISPHRPGPYAEAFGCRTHASPEGFRQDFDECLAAVDALLRGEQIELRAAGHRGHEVSSAIVPDVQPQWYRAAYSADSITAAAQSRMPLLQHYIQSPASIMRGREIYSASLGEAAQPLLRESPVHRFILIGADDASARRSAKQYARLLTDRLRSFGIDRRGDITAPEDLVAERFIDETAIVGSADTVYDRIVDLAARTGAGTVNVNLGWMGVVDHEQVTASARHLIDGVLGRLARQF